MSAKFRIKKQTTEGWPGWILTYPAGFYKQSYGCIFLGLICPTFESAVEAFIAAELRLCPMCGRGSVEHLEWGWECQACGCSDVASGRVRPTPERECTCAMSEASHRSCAMHGEKAPAR